MLLRDAVLRRDFLKLSAAGVVGISPSDWLLPRLAYAAEGTAERPRACIMLHMQGGVSQHHTFTVRDYKAENAQIDTAVPGVKFCNPFSKDGPVSKHWQAACRNWGFAYVLVNFDAVKKDEFTLLKTGLADLAKQSGHPELEHLPLCFIGMSRGGGMSVQLAELLPERTIAAVPVCLEVGPESDATRRVPMITVFGEKDGKQMQKLLDKRPAGRQLDARWGIAVQWNRQHEFGQANNLSFVFFDDVIARRLPKMPPSDRPVSLAEFPLEDGWLCDTTTWGKDGRQPTIAAWKDFTGDRAKACWFPTGRTAAVWRAFVGATKDVTITEPAGLGDGQAFVMHSAKKPIAVKLGLAAKLKPESVELWDGNVRLAEKKEGPWAFEATMKPGIHALYAVVRSPGREPLTSRPHTIVVTD